MDENLNKYEAEMMTAYLTVEDENDLKGANLNTKPEHIVQTMMSAFDLFDLNDNGEISEVEI